MKALFEAALEYTRKGFYVFPLNPKGKKVTRMFGKISSSRDEKDIIRWWKELPYLNVGIATSKYNDGIFVIDVDVKEDVNGVIALKELTFKYNLAIPETAVAKSGSGGYHLYFKNCTDKIVTCSNGKKLGIDIRAEKAHIVAPPSIHKNGNMYEWYIGDIDSIAEATDDVFKLVDIINSINAQEYVAKEYEDLVEMIKLAVSNDSYLTLFSSYSVGAGKTYKMLEYAKHRFASDSVIVGYINDSHRNFDGDIFDYKKYIDNTITKETKQPYTMSINIEEILKRKPDVVIIDELGYKNAYTGNRIYKDIIRLLSEGISVVSSCNINIMDVANAQLKDITHMSYKNTIPDFFMQLVNHIYFIECDEMKIKERYNDDVLFKDKTKLLDRYMSNEVLKHNHDISLMVLDNYFSGRYSIIKEKN